MRVLSALLLFALSAGTDTDPADGPVSELKVTLQVLVDLSQWNPGPGDPMVSSDRHRVAFVHQGKERPPRSSVVVNGQEGTRFERVVEGTLRFDATGSHLAYVVQRGSTMSVVLDGETGEPFGAIGESGVVFDETGQHYAFMASRGDAQLVVVDGKEGERFDTVTSPVFGADGRAAYVAQKNGRQTVVLVEGPDTKPRDLQWFDAVLGPPVLSADGRLAFVVEQEGRQHLVVDGVPGEPVEGIGDGTPLFDDSGRRMAVIQRSAGGWKVVVDGTDGAEWLGIVRDSLVFSPGRPLNEPGVDPELGIVTGFLGYSPSAHYAYLAGDGTLIHVVLDGAVVASGTGVRGDVLFDASGEHYAWVLMEGEREWLMVDGKKVRDGDAIAGVSFAPEGGEVACVVASGDELTYHVGPRSFGPYQGGTPVQFSPDGHWRACVQSSEGSCLLVDGELVCADQDREILKDSLVDDGGALSWLESGESDVVVAVRQADGALRRSVPQNWAVMASQESLPKAEGGIVSAVVRSGRRIVRVSWSLRAP